MNIQTSHCLILAPIALSLFVAVRLSLGSVDDAKRSWLLMAVRGSIVIMLLVALLGIGARAHWLGLAWFVILGVFFFVALWKQRRLERETLLLTALQAQGLKHRQLLANAYVEENTGWLRRKGNALRRDLALGIPWGVALERRGVATGVYEKLALRLSELYGTEVHSESRIVMSPAQIESEAERLLGRLMVFGWTILMLPLIYFMVVYIIPTFEEMFEEFGLELPVPMQWIITTADWSTSTGTSLAFLCFTGLLMGLTTLLVMVWMFPVLLQTPLFRWMCADYYHNVGLVGLTYVADREQDLVTAFERCAVLIPVSHVARRYGVVGERLRNGENVERSVAQAGLLRSSELALFRSSMDGVDLNADPIWGLRQLAGWRLERMFARYSTAVQLLVVFGTLALGLVIGVFAIAFIMTLAAMITALA